MNTLMRRPRTQDDYRYQKISNAQPKKHYRACPYCGKKFGIPEPYKKAACYMCGSMIYVDESKNDIERDKYNFMKQLQKKGIELNDKEIIRRTKIQKEI